eukprot:COSAG05_NODE_517_length_9060_cov_7.019306_10_plen_79_part_00
MNGGAATVGTMSLPLTPLVTDIQWPPVMVSDHWRLISTLSWMARSHMRHPLEKKALEKKLEDARTMVKIPFYMFILKR